MSKMHIFTNAMLQNREGLTDIAVAGDIFLKIQPDLTALFPEAETTDLGGRLVIPPYVDSHIHLDYVNTALLSKTANHSSTLFEGIECWANQKESFTEEEIKERAREVIRDLIGYGVQYVRTHVDVTEPSLRGMRAMLELREEMRPYMRIQLVAFPQEGMLSFPGGAELVEEGLRMGADAVGAIPHWEFTREMGIDSVRRAVELAVRYDRLVDVHCDETDDEQSRFLETLAAAAHHAGIGARVTASHACASGAYNGAYFQRLLRLVQISGMNFAICPPENLHLQGRWDGYPKRRGIARVAELLDAGVNVSFGQDSICDPWYPMGTGNPLNVLDVGVHACQLTDLERSAGCLDLVTVNGARTLGLEPGEYGIEEGRPANFLVLDAYRTFDAVRRHARVLRSVREGRMLFTREPDRMHSDDAFLNDFA